MKEGTTGQPSEGRGGSAPPKGLIELWFSELERWIQRKDHEMGGPVSAPDPLSEEVAAEGE